MTQETRYGWHFLPDDGKLVRYTVGRRDKVKVGKTYTVKGEIAVCGNGLHGSADPLVSLANAPGGVVTWCEFTGPFSDDTDGKFAARSRKVLAMADVTTELHEFAVYCARRALMRERKAGREPDKRSWNALTVKRAWLRGKATDDQLAAAWGAAWGAAWDAARAAARAAAWGAAWDAARGAAWAAARGAARDAARDAEAAIQRKRLTASLRRAVNA